MKDDACVYIYEYIYVYTENKQSSQNCYQFKSRACISMHSHRVHSLSHRCCHEFKWASMIHGVQNEAEVPVTHKLFDF